MRHARSYLLAGFAAFAVGAVAFAQTTVAPLEEAEPVETLPLESVDALAELAKTKPGNAQNGAALAGVSVEVSMLAALGRTRYPRWSAPLVMPLLLEHLAATDYPDLARLGKDSLLASTWNSVRAALLFIIGWVLTLPLWLIPGMGLLLPLLWMAWLNRRTFAYDALSLHATQEEWQHLRRQRANVLIWLGLVMALLTHVPLLGLFAPSLAALAYIHFCLEALRRLRQGAIVAIHSDVKLAEKSA